MRAFFLALAVFVVAAIPAAAQPVAVDVLFTSVGNDEQTGQPALKIRMSDEGRQVFSAFTEQNVGRTIDVLVDGVVVTSSMLHTPIHSEWIIITGSFVMSELEAMSEIINRSEGAVTLRPAKIKSGS